MTKQGVEPISGTVTFSAGEKALGTADFSLPSGVGGVVVALSFVPEKGTHTVSAKITKAVSGDEELAVTGEVKAEEKLVVEPDNDRDAIADEKDADDDNDGVSDADEKAAGTDPLAKEVKASSSAGVVAGTSTEALGQAGAYAKDLSAMLLSKAESLRGAGANYFDRKLAEAEAEKKAAQETAKPEDRTDLDTIFVAEPKSITEQVKDSSGILSGLKVQAFKALSFIFNNMYAFYIVLIVLILWILRKIWRRHSLD